MKKLIGVAILGAALGAQPAPAQPAGQGPRAGGPRAIVEYLDLTSAQQDQWKTLREQHRSEMKALREEGRELRQRLQEALEADAPDAEVGAAAKAAFAHRQQVKQARGALETQLKSVLTPEQKERYEAFQAARKVDRKGRGTRGHRGRRPAEG